MRFHQHLGFVLFWVNRSFRPVCCRDCGLALFRQKQNLTLLTGWWGIASLLVWNWVTIIVNLVQRGKLNSLPAPIRPAGARALDPGRPVFLRPGMVLVYVLVPLVLIAVVAITVASSS